MSAYSDLIVAANPVSYWRCSDGPGATTLADQMGANPLTLGTVGTGSFNDSPGGLLGRDGNSALQFVGDYTSSNGAFAFAAPAGGYKGADFSFEFWVNIPAKSGSFTAPIFSLVTGNSAAETNTFFINTNSQQGTFFTLPQGTGESLGPINGAYSTTVPTYIACVCTGGNVISSAARKAVYTNSTFRTTHAAGYNNTTNNLGFLIGGRLTAGPTNYAAFTIQEVAFYGYGLSQVQIQDHYLAGLAAAQPPLVLGTTILRRSR